MQGGEANAPQLFFLPKNSFFLLGGGWVTTDLKFLVLWAKLLLRPSVTPKFRTLVVLLPNYAGSKH